MSPLEKVPFSTFRPLQKYLWGTCLFKKKLFKVGSNMENNKLLLRSCFVAKKSQVHLVPTPSRNSVGVWPTIFLK